MKSIDSEQNVRRIIQIITTELDEQLIKHRIDEPISKAVEQYVYEATFPMTHMTFNNIISDFMKHVYGNAFKASWPLKDPLARGIWLLENFYRNDIFGLGYEAALLDADEMAENGIDTVLITLADVIKNIERQNYTEAVFTSHLLGANWDLRCEIVKILLEDNAPYLPKRLRIGDSAQHVNEIQNIMQELMNCDSILGQLSFYKETQFTAELLKCLAGSYQ